MRIASPLSVRSAYQMDAAITRHAPMHTSMCVRSPAGWLPRSRSQPTSAPTIMDATILATPSSVPASSPIAVRTPI